MIDKKRRRQKNEAPLSFFIDVVIRVRHSGPKENR